MRQQDRLRPSAARGPSAQEAPATPGPAGRRRPGRRRRGPGWRPGGWRPGGLDPLVQDGLLAGALAGMGVIGLLVGVGTGLLPKGSEPPTLLAGLLVVGQSAPVAWRRRAPLPVLAVVEVSTIAYFLLHFAPTGAALGAVIAFYTVAARYPTPVVLPFAAGFAGGVLDLTVQGRLSFETFVLLHVLFAAAWLMGGEQRARRAYTALVEDRAARLERELGYLAREAVADQRVRLTRELHRTVTDDVSTMVARARAAGQRLPAVASGSRDLRGVIETGERVLTELRRGSEVLSPAEPVVVPTETQAMMSQLSALVTEVKMAGLPIDVTVEGAAVPLPAEVDGSAYRIVQEALTTCFKRPGSSRPQVLIRFGDGDLELHVTDDPGPGWQVDPDGGRYENLGWMQPRDAEPEVLPEGGYGVLARLPIGSGR
ncbi:MAG TPA: hypothetical protein VFD04_13970 [Actinomycetes bacterium]|nr:hypothetical protein [Actinomycetes bacterium]